MVISPSSAAILKHSLAHAATKLLCIWVRCENTSSSYKSHFFNKVRESFLELTRTGRVDNLFSLSGASPLFSMLLSSFCDVVEDDAPCICTVKLPPKIERYRYGKHLRNKCFGACGVRGEQKHRQTQVSAGQKRCYSDAHKL